MSKGYEKNGITHINKEVYVINELTKSKDVIGQLLDLRVPYESSMRACIMDKLDERIALEEERKNGFGGKYHRKITPCRNNEFKVYLWDAAIFKEIAIVFDKVFLKSKTNNLSIKLKLNKHFSISGLIYIVIHEKTYKDFIEFNKSKGSEISLSDLYLEFELVDHTKDITINNETERSLAALYHMLKRDGKLEAFNENKFMN